MPLTLALLSPADRPIQVTADLPGFWTGSWADVRKDLAGRYPKHRWPDDPGHADPGRLKAADLDLPSECLRPTECLRRAPRRRHSGAANTG